MSTKSSIVYLEDGDVHLFREVMDEENRLYLQMPHGGDFSVNGHNFRISFPGELWDELVDQYVAKRERARERAAERRERIKECLTTRGAHKWESDALATWGTKMCVRCGAFEHEGPSLLEILGEFAEEGE